MLNPGYTTLSKFLIQHVPEGPHGRELAALLVDVAAVIKAISAAVGKGPLSGMSGLAGSENAQGETQKKLDVVSDELFVRGVEWSGLVGALASEEMDDVHFVEGQGRLALVFDPLDGSSNIDVNVAIGSIFSVLALPEGASTAMSVMQPGTKQLAAGYAIYGPSTQLVLTLPRELATRFTDAWTTFLNQDTPVFLGTEKIARKLGHPIVYVGIRTVGRGRYVMRFEDLVPEPARTADGEISELHTRRLEADIRRDPAHWLWSHRRWKHRRPNT